MLNSIFFFFYSFPSFFQLCPEKKKRCVCQRINKLCILPGNVEEMLLISKAFIWREFVESEGKTFSYTLLASAVNKCVISLLPSKTECKNEPHFISSKLCFILPACISLFYIRYFLYYSLYYIFRYLHIILDIYLCVILGREHLYMSCSNHLCPVVPVSLSSRVTVSWFMASCALILLSKYAVEMKV